jgi:succinate dehydrogenase/fumarate reductase flavoprotein subunit
MYRAVETDVLVIGNGGAGLRAAIEASRANVEVLIVARTIPGKAHTTMAEGGINAALANRDPTDSVEDHFKDTVLEGAYLNDQRLVDALVREIPDRVYDLEEFGAVFDRTIEGKIAQRPFGGQSHPRTCYVGDETGHEMIMALVEEMRRRDIPHMDEVMITRLLTDGGRCAGALGLDMRTGGYLVFRAKATILATGGAGRVYQVTSNPDEATGDGYAMAYDIGAELMDMEQVQFHPTGMIFPESAKGILVTEAVRGEGGLLKNSKGERFMERYNPSQMELSPRDIVARSIYSEIQAGRGTPRGGVYLDITHKGRDHIIKKLPRMVRQFKIFADLDITGQPMEVAPTAHHFMGGIKIRVEDNRSTTVEGLYPVGEAEAGVHGGNRLGGNALAETQVFGARAGLSAASWAKSGPSPKLDREQIEKEIVRLDSMFREGKKPQAMKEQIRGLMWQYVGIVRNRDDLIFALSELEKLGRDSNELGVSGGKKYNPEWCDAITIPHMLLVCEAIVRSALAREESRGAHFRSDFPKRDDANWFVNINLKKGVAGKMKTTTSPIFAIRMRPSAIAGDVIV